MIFLKIVAVLLAVAAAFSIAVYVFSKKRKSYNQVEDILETDLPWTLVKAAEERLGDVVEFDYDEFKGWIQNYPPIPEIKQKEVSKKKVSKKKVSKKKVTKKISKKASKKKVSKK